MGSARPARPAVPVAPAADHPSAPAYAVVEATPEPVETRPLPVAVAQVRAEGPAPAAAPPPGPAAVAAARPVAELRHPAEASSAPPAAVATEPGPIAGAVVGPAGSPDGEAPRTTCTQAQLRRFIKSRPWVPMHELRRRFGIYGADDDVTPVRMGTTTVFVGLPAAEGRMLGELLVSGDVGYELSLDPEAPIVVGVYPMRPVPRG
jgi:hypothetical protein